MGKNKKISKQEFDTIIKDNLIEFGESKENFGYKMDENRTYDNYYTAQEFEKFVNEMKKNYEKHYKKFYGIQEVEENKGGQGSELVLKRGKWGMIPPKMASVASSSRFCYLALRDGSTVLIPNRILTKSDVEFEKECKIFSDSSHAPQLDAYIRDSVCDYYVEAKCHEIFDSHKIEFKNKYWKIFENDKVFSCVLGKAIKNKDTFELPRNVFQIKGEHLRFDVKQFICHLFGIANQLNGKKAKLIYLFFKPKCSSEDISQKIEEVFKELQVEIETIFGRCELIRKFCENNDIELIAMVEHSDVMEKLNNYNVEKLFPVE